MLLLAIVRSCSTTGCPGIIFGPKKRKVIGSGRQFGINAV
jgi:hypothetical protein